MVVVLPRSAWTLRTNAWSYSLKPSAVTAMAIHWPGTPVRTYRLDEKSIAKVIAGFESYHVGTRGWPGIGYCYLVDWQGRLWEGAGDRKAAHSATSAYPNANAEIIGVQLILGTEDEVTPAMVETVRDLYAEKRAKFPLLSRITDHRSIPGASTTCPGPRAHADVVAGTFYPTATPTTPEDDMPTPQELIDALAAARYVTPSTAPRSIFDALNHLISLTDTALLEQRAQTVALTAAVQALAGAVGVDPAQVQATVREAVDAALAGLRISREA